ncbi:hypothetical protein [Streptomyces xanthochromogenes]|uniref:hypothetical protein n=1 Tax=Streptomyces xanthochromogenes TaxID=67384 RepID=UPI00341F2791
MGGFPEIDGEVFPEQFGELLAVEDAFADVDVLAEAEALDGGEEILAVQMVRRDPSSRLRSAVAVR